ncbi:MAG: outer membrane lipoprotein-sorting protein, partial [Vicinamibacteria bacterium]
VRTILAKSKNYEHDLTKSVSWFLSPADVKGTGFLTWENDGRDDDQFLYLPAIKKTRRIASSERDQKFLGTDFSFEDMQGRETEDGVHTLLGEETYNGKGVWKVQTLPTPESDSQYSKIIAIIEKDSYLLQKADLFDKDGELYKIFYIDDWSKVNGFWTSLHSRMENLRDDHKTFLDLEDVKHNQGLPDEVFTTRSLERGL